MQHLLDLSLAKCGAEEGGLLNVSSPQPLAQLIQLLHAHCGQLPGVRATLPSLTNRIKVTVYIHKIFTNLAQEPILWDLVS